MNDPDAGMRPVQSTEQGGNDDVMLEVWREMKRFLHCDNVGAFKEKSPQELCGNGKRRVSRRRGPGDVKRKAAEA